MELQKELNEKMIKNLIELENICRDSRKSISEKLSEAYFLGFKHGKEF